MTFRNRLQYLLVRKLRISNKDALQAIWGGNVLVNNIVQLLNVEVTIEDTIEYNGQVVQMGEKFLYIAFYKPVGIETTLNENVDANLKNILPFKEKLFPIGRLDKASEGLLILTNDGGLFNTILNQKNKIEKEYLVTIDKIIDDNFIHSMSNGIKIMGRMTLPCKVEKTESDVFSISLIEGRNRQIRRMCYKLGCTVIKLVRIRIGNIRIGNLQPNNFRHIESKEAVLG
jgi:23S rRNA pseudouridine2604 synthase